MLGAELAFSKAFLDAFTWLDVFDERDALRRVVGIVQKVRTDEQAALLGRAYGRSLLVLAADLPRWRTATDLAVRFDLHEALPSLLQGLHEHPDAHQLSNAASLVSSPAVPGELRDELERLIAGTDLTASLKRLLQLRLHASALAESDLEAVVQAQSWPGAAKPALLPRLGPMVYVAERDAPKVSFWHIVASLAASGARVRRLPVAWTRRGERAWYQPNYPLVHWSGTALVDLRSEFPQVTPKAIPAPHDSASVTETERLLRRCGDALPAGVALRRSPEWSSVDLPAFAPASLNIGGYDAAEMSYLGAASVHTVRRLAQEALRPYAADVNRWPFGKLVTLRIVQAFKSRGVHLQAGPGRILQQLETIAAASESRRVGIDARGVVFVEGDDAFEAMHSGQRAITGAVLVDDAFRSFRLGGGQVPDLLRPGQHTVVHPAVLGGTPVVYGRRLPARALAQLLEARGEKVARSAYPELQAVEMYDAARVGRMILTHASS